MTNFKSIFNRKLFLGKRRFRNFNSWKKDRKRNLFRKKIYKKKKLHKKRV